MTLRQRGYLMEGKLASIKNEVQLRILKVLSKGNPKTVKALGHRMRNPSEATIRKHAELLVKAGMLGRLSGWEDVPRREGGGRKVGARKVVRYHLVDSAIEREAIKLDVEVVKK